MAKLIDVILNLDGTETMVYADGSTKTIGTDGDDVIVGTDGDDKLIGAEGDDTLNGMGGDDKLIGGDGNDTLDGDQGSDVILAGDGDDTAIYELADYEAGDIDYYNGGSSDNDTLKIVLDQAAVDASGYATAQDYADALMAHFNDSGNRADFRKFNDGNAGALDLVAKNFEVLEIELPPDLEPDILAVAYSDLNDNDVYDEGTDLLIAKVLDTDESGTVSVGDEIFLGSYPNSPLDATTHTDFSNTEAPLEVLNVNIANSQEIQADFSGGGFSLVQGLAGQEGFRVFEFSGQAVRVTDDADSAVSFGLDDSVDVSNLFPNSSGPITNQASMSTMLVNLGDDNFLDVDIFI